MAGKVEVCLSCNRKYRSCICKCCGLCGTQFQTSVGFVRQRSHCRSCGNAICSHCYTSGGQKICNVCRREQKKATMQIKHRLSTRANTENDSNTNTDDRVTGSELGLLGGGGGGSGSSGIDLMPDGMAAAAAALPDAQKRSLLIEAAKQGDHHVIVTLLEAGSDVNSADSQGNTSLIWAAERARLPCLVLLLERGANIRATNNLGQTALHSLARNADSIDHVECLDYLVQMGSDVFAEDGNGMMPYDVACKFSRISDVIDHLGVAQALCAIENLKACVATGCFSNLREARGRDIEKWINSLVSQTRNRSNVLFKEERDNKLNPVTSNTVEHNHSFSPTRDEEEEKQPASNDEAHVDPLLERSDAFDVADSNNGGRKLIGKLVERAEDLEKKREELETQCRTLVQTIGKITAAHQKENQQWEEKLAALAKEKEIAVRKTESIYENRIAKVEEDSRRFLEKAKKQIEEMDTEKSDLLHLQQNFNLTWVPDELVRFCTNAKCAKAFTTTRRRHHCRCCGRVFCAKCTTNQATILSLGYSRLVRVCSTCYALVDDLIAETPITQRPQGEDSDSEEDSSSSRTK